MNDRFFQALAAMLAIIAVALVMVQRSPGPVDRASEERIVPDRVARTASSGVDRPEAPRRRRPVGDPLVDQIRDELDRTRLELEQISRPLHRDDVLSSAVHAVVAEGETLVTGGYQLADGRYELTFISPRGVDADGASPGQDAILIETRTLVVDEAFVAADGLDTLTTQVRNTLQHAETWQGSDMFNTFKAASEADGVDMDAMPTVTTAPDEPFEITLAGSAGGSLLLTGTANLFDEGRFALKTRVERTE